MKGKIMVYDNRIHISGIWLLGLFFPLITLTISVGDVFELSLYMILTLFFGSIAWFELNSKWKFSLNKAEGGFLILLFFMVASLYYVPNPNHGVIKLVKILFLITLYIFSKFIFAKSENIRVVMKVSAFSMVVYIAYVSYYYIYVKGLTYIGMDIKEFGSSGRNSLALVLLIVLSFTIGSLYKLDRYENKIMYLIVGLLSIGALLLQSRGIIVALTGSIIFILVKEKSIRNFRIIIALVVVIIVFIIIAPESLKVQVQERLLSIVALVDKNISITEGAGSVSIRKKLIGISLAIFYDAPILGIGFGGFEYFNAWGYTGPHNDYLLFLSELGVFGIILYCFVVFSFLNMAYKNYKMIGDSLASGILFTMLSLCIYSLFMNTYDSFLVWSIYAMVSTTHSRIRQEFVNQNYRLSSKLCIKTTKAINKS